MINLTDKNILVTGASSGIGQEIAISAAKLGANIIAIGKNNTALQHTLQQLNGLKHQAINADLTDANTISDIIQAFDFKLDGVVHSAGISRHYPIKYITDKQINEIFSINFNAPVLLTTALLKNKKIAKNCSIVFLSSIVAHTPVKSGSLYAASKAALESFSNGIASECATQGIRSNCIAPGMVETPMYEEAKQMVSEDFMNKHIQQYPLGIGKTSDVANVAVFLLSNLSRWITGTIIRLDGGLLAGAK